MSILEYIPPALRAPAIALDHPLGKADIEGYLARAESTLMLYLTPAIASQEITPEEAHWLLFGFAEHQRAIVRASRERDDSFESKVFKGSIKTIELQVRNLRDDNSYLGTKALVKYTPESGDRRNSEEDISTSWLTYGKAVGQHNLWEIALTRSLIIDIENAAKGQVRLRKAYVHGVEGLTQGDRVKYLADVMPVRRVQKRPYVDEELAERAVRIATDNHKSGSPVDDVCEIVAETIEETTDKVISDASFEVLSDFVATFIDSGNGDKFKRQLMGFFPKVA